MDRAMDLCELHLQLGRSLALVGQERWLLGGVRDGGLTVVADSALDTEPPGGRRRRLSPMARRCLQEGRPLTVRMGATTCLAAGPPRWLLYAPVGLPRRRPVGLLIVSRRAGQPYPEDEIEYVGALAVSLTGPLLRLCGPLAQLSERELQMARLLAHRLSPFEAAAVLRIDPDEARRLVGDVLRKLRLRSTAQLVEVWPGLEPLAAWR
ncbi:MAG TPA: hypothetical protein VFD01_14025 [Candidatus Dormibacteraeota bacterium]|nr:hypothetical protein [Candidatus Dormibacteraeota bacterium]